jgi:hypothetical protein
MVTQPCINPNPDIAGVGVRVSVYVQALLNLASIVLFAAPDGISVPDFSVMVTQFSIPIPYWMCYLIVGDHSSNDVRI